MEIDTWLVFVVENNAAIILSFYFSVPVNFNLKLCQNKKDQIFVGILVFWIFFFLIWISCLLQKKDLKMSILTNVLPFLFCQGFTKYGSPLIVRFLGPRKKNVLMEIRTIRGVFMVYIGKSGI